MRTVNRFGFTGDRALPVLPFRSIPTKSGGDSESPEGLNRFDCWFQVSSTDPSTGFRESATRKEKES